MGVDKVRLLQKRTTPYAFIVPLQLPVSKAYAGKRPIELLGL